MANIKITALSNVSPVSAAGYIYKDIHLDFIFGYTTSGQLFKQNEINDLQADTDYVAIRTALFNLFNTNKGERVLTPEFGLNLKQFLFTPITKQTASLIGDTIRTGITQFEPRVTVQKISIIADADNNQYTIYLVVSINNASLTISGILSNSGYQLSN